MVRATNAMPNKGIMFSGDKELVDALRAGDQRALDQINAMCYTTFGMYVRSCGGTEEDAEDCFQEGVLSVWVNVQHGRYDLRETASFKTYILGVCKYKWMNKMRSAYRKNVTLATELPEIQAITSFVEVSGDIGTPEDSTDNAYHVFTIDPSCLNCILDGLTIQFGQADLLAGQASIGAGILNEGTLMVNNCIIERNTAIQEGAAIYNNGAMADLTIRDCIFRLNTSKLQRDILNAAGANIKFQGLIQIQE